MGKRSEHFQLRGDPGQTQVMLVSRPRADVGMAWDPQTGVGGGGQAESAKVFLLRRRDLAKTSILVPSTSDC